MKLITSWDDSHSLDIGLAQMLESHHIPAIFFIPNQISKFNPDDIISEDFIRELHKRGFEIGGHTYKHPSDLKLLFGKDLEDEIVKNKNWLEEVIKAPVTKFCYPSGRYNDLTVKAVKAAGYKSARTTVTMNTTEPIDSFRIATTVHVYPKRKEYGERKWYEVAMSLYKEAMRKNEYFHLWGHSWEIEKFNLWEELDKFFSEISKDAHEWNREDISI